MTALRVLLCLFLFAPFLLRAQSEVVFTEVGCWEEVIELAKAENKPVFVDFYADWCPPCKAFNLEVLGDPAVARFLNRYYVNIKIDAETTTGREIAAGLGIKVYPTIYLLDNQGRTRQMIEGLPEREEFVSQIRQVRRMSR